MPEAWSRKAGAYSYRNAVTGLSRVACRAGIKQAVTPTATSRIVIDTSVIGSVGPVCTSKLRRSLPTPKAPANPIVRPIRELYHAPPEDQVPHLMRLGAERHADADLLRALRDGVGGHRIEADRRQDDGDAGKHREHRAEHADVPTLLREVLIHRPDVRQRHVGIQRRRSPSEAAP